MEQGFRKARPRSGTARGVLLSIAKKPKCVARATGAHVRCVGAGQRRNEEKISCRGHATGGKLRL